MNPGARRRRAGRASWIAAVAVASLCAAGRLHAAESIVVHFEFDEPAIAQLFDPARAAAERQVSADLARDLSTAVGFWAFVPGDQYPQLRVRIRKTAADWQIVTALYANPSTAARSWPVTWRTEADLLRTGGFGPPPEIVASVERAFQGVFLQQQKDALVDTLKMVVPLVRPQHTVAIDPSGAVLPLDWSRYETLKVSEFLVRYQLTDGIAALTCRGVGTPSPYPAPPPAEGLRVSVDPRYDLAGQKLALQGRLADFRGLTPIGIYLVHYDDLGAFLQSPAGTPAAALAVPPGR